MLSENAHIYFFSLWSGSNNNDNVDVGVTQIYDNQSNMYGKCESVCKTILLAPVPSSLILIQELPTLNTTFVYELPIFFLHGRIQTIFFFWRRWIPRWAGTRRYIICVQIRIEEEGKFEENQENAHIKLFIYACRLHSFLLISLFYAAGPFIFILIGSFSLSLWLSSLESASLLLCWDD